MIQRFVISFRELPKPVKVSFIIYLNCLLGYNMYGTYTDSKKYLEKFREGKIKEFEKNDIKTDWDAVKYGAKSRYFERLWDSIVWPITSINNIVPALVLSLNPPSPKNNE